MKKEEKSFEEKMIELEKIVASLESGETPLDDAITKFNDAMILAKDCNKVLEEANETVNKVLTKEETFEKFEVE